MIGKTYFTHLSSLRVNWNIPNSWLLSILAPTCPSSEPICSDDRTEEYLEQVQFKAVKTNMQ